MAEDQRQTGGSPSDRRTTLTQTADVMGQGATGAITLMYCIACLKSHALLTPTFDQAAGLLGTFGSFFHLLGRVVMYWTGRLLPKDASS